MKSTIYITRQGCTVNLVKEKIIIKHKGIVCQECQLPLIDLILVFGSSQLTTQVIKACLQRGIAIIYLSRSGYCYGRLLPVSKSRQSLIAHQVQLTDEQKLFVSRQLIHAKLHNCRVILLRQHRRNPDHKIQFGIQSLQGMVARSLTAQTLPELMGIEGAGARAYFEALGACFQHPDLVFEGRSRRPPGNEINALLSFGYQVLWNHLLGLVENYGLDAHQGCLHTNHHGHAALVSDLLEPFRAPVIDTLVLWLVNTPVIKAQEDFEFKEGGCFLNALGRKRFLHAFLLRMDKANQKNLFWSVIIKQIQAFCQWLIQPTDSFWCYRIT